MLLRDRIRQWLNGPADEYLDDVPASMLGIGLYTPSGDMDEADKVGVYAYASGQPVFLNAHDLRSTALIMYMVADELERRNEV